MSSKNHNNEKVLSETYLVTNLRKNEFGKSSIILAIGLDIAILKTNIETGATAKTSTVIIQI